MQPDAESGAIKFAERMLALLDRGNFVATYKYAVLIGLMDLCMEGTTRTGAPPGMVTTTQLAEKVVQLYWPHTLPYQKGILRQNTGSQARIVTDIARFRDRLRSAPSTLHQAANDDPKAYRRLIYQVEWTLILMPLPRVQVIGRSEDRIIYDIGWDAGIERNKKIVTEYQKKGDTGLFDNRIIFNRGVPEYLVMLNGLLRPLIYREWAGMVAQINKLEESRLQEFLFGANRVPLEPVRMGLREMQDDRCFYCGEKFKSAVEVDHFIPWSRYPDNGIENLVAAHRGCNGAKRDFLASAAHVHRWMSRNAPGSTSAGDLQEIARKKHWERHPDQTAGVARAIYLRLPPEAKLWHAGDLFVPADTDQLSEALG